jgi:hypothetical protein
MRGESDDADGSRGGSSEFVSMDEGPLVAKTQGGEVRNEASVTSASGANQLEAPELPVAYFSFLLHFVWEFVQVPAFVGMMEMNHWDGIKLCMSATFGDVGIALAAYWTASAVARSRSWVLHPTRLPVAVFLAVGLGLTFVFEFYYTNISLRWAYSDLMPLVPPFGTGLLPLLQWAIIPPIVLWLSSRHLRGVRSS